MRLSYLALLLGLATLVQTGCKSCRHCETMAPPPACQGPIVTPPAYQTPVAPPPFAPAVGTLPAADPDRTTAEPPRLPVRPSSLTSWVR